MNDARNKLRSMGGIMASYPELMQAAQRFNNGGIAGTTAPLAAPLPAVRPAGLPEDITAELMAESSAIYPLDGSLAPMAFSSAADALGGELGSFASAPMAFSSAADALGGELESFAPAEDTVTSMPLTPATEPFGAAERRAARKGPLRPPHREEKIGGVAPRSSAAERRAARRGDRSPLGGVAPSSASAEETVMAQEVAPSMTPEQMTEEGRKALEGLVPPKSEDPAEAEKIAQDAMSVLLKTPQPTGGDDEETPAKTLEDYYKDARDLISKVYGEEDDGVDNRMMDLAMIGLAIAAGQSPNALSNIAQGVLVGTQGMAQRREAERERELGLRTLAFEYATGEMDAAREAEQARLEREAEAEARAAEAEYDRETQYEVARIRSQGTAGSTYTPERLRQLVTNNITSNPGEYPSLLTEDGSLDPNKLNRFVQDVVKGVSASSAFNPALQARITEDLKTESPEKIRAALEKQNIDPSLYEGL